MNRIMIIGNDNYITNYLLNKGFYIDLILDKTDCDEELYPPVTNVNHFFVNDASNSTEVMSVMMQFRDTSTEYFAIFSRYEHTIETASILGHLYPCKHEIPLNTSMNFRNKFIQKKILTEIVPVPKVQYIERLENFSIHQLKLEFPIVYKPIDGEGTMNTGIIKNDEELLKIIKKLNDNNKMNLLLEEFIQGEEFIIDGWVENKKIQNFTISKYNAPIINIKKGELISILNLHYKDHPSLYDNMKSFIYSSLNALQLNNGVFHMEVFIKKDGSIVFSECAMRIGGGLFKEIIDNIYDIDILDYFIELNINNGVKKAERNDIRTGFSFLPNPKSIDSVLPSLNEIQKVFPQVKKVQYKWQTGEELPTYKENYINRIGFILVEGKSEEEVTNTINDIQKYFKNI